MFRLVLQPLHHRGGEKIALQFTFNKELNDKVKLLPDVRWSRTHCCWYVPLTKQHYQQVTKALSPFVSFESTALKQYLEQRKAMQPVIERKDALSHKRSYLLQEYPLNKENLAAFTLFQQKLQLKA